MRDYLLVCIVSLPSSRLILFCLNVTGRDLFFCWSARYILVLLWYSYTNMKSKKMRHFFRCSIQWHQSFWCRNRNWFRDNWSLKFDALASCVARSSVTTVLNIQFTRVLVFLLDYFNYRCHISFENYRKCKYIFLCFLKWIQHDKGSIES